AAGGLGVGASLAPFALLVLVTFVQVGAALVGVGAERFPARAVSRALERLVQRLPASPHRSLVLSGGELVSVLVSFEHTRLGERRRPRLRRQPAAHGRLLAVVVQRCRAGHGAVRRRLVAAPAAAAAPAPPPPSSVPARVPARAALRGRGLVGAGAGGSAL